MATNYNPDVLNCLANLSNDEVFTPPALANQVLDLLPQELFKSPDTKFLDPFTKSGVFLREIVKRLDRGLQTTIPDRQERIDHILHEQVYGIACTELTALLSRRSLYCSKAADGQYSVSKFGSKDGNILYSSIEHTWEGGRCKYCGANQSGYDRSSASEQYAYQFIHTDNPNDFYSMTFDVIIGNPYQLTTAGDENGAQARPIYQLFVQQAKKLNPRYLTMITPSRWFAGGWGLDEFRTEMMNCDQIREIHDYPISSDCFAGVQIKGGVSYFLWDRDNKGMCKFVTHLGGKEDSSSIRFLHEKNCESIIRNNEFLSIFRKVQNKPGFISFDKFVSGRSPFGFNTNHHGSKSKSSPTDILYYERSGYTYMPENSISRNKDYIDKYKIYISKAYGAGEGFPHQILNKPIFGDKGTICSGTYLMIGPFESKEETLNVLDYISTKFFRALVAINKISQDASYKVYSSVPVVDFSKKWTDELLYQEYCLSKADIAFIEDNIRPLGFDE